MPLPEESKENPRVQLEFEVLLAFLHLVYNVAELGLRVPSIWVNCPSKHDYVN